MTDDPHNAGAPGTVDDRPRWEGPPETRPSGYLPAVDNPAISPDAAGETLVKPDRPGIGEAPLTERRTTTMDHSTHSRLSAEELRADVIEGATIYGADDEKVGTVSHMHGTGVGSQVIVDVGGFLGIGAKPVAVSASALDFMRDADGEVHAVTTWTKDQLKDMPEHHH